LYRTAEVTHDDVWHEVKKVSNSRLEAIAISWSFVG
jgi:hypothetical protein